MSDENIVHLGPRFNEPALDAVWTPLGATPYTWEQRIVYGLAHYDAYKAPSEFAPVESRHGSCTRDATLRLARHSAERIGGTESDSYWPEEQQESENEDDHLQRMAAYHSDVSFVLRMLGVGPTDACAEQARTVLLPFLHAECLVTYDRTLCARSLGHLREERALPVL